ncbi:lipid-A-disaccharide synthase [Ideonella paludis]|uniref:Lipid-A-disaccharide synthase n=1 Tax=Ideonella paludis TaxID=1233411 RepID=A0ABS5DUS7_9BURK|nr:lipid-A-disaccharide synthase [Ideonella paludis]MBQ0934887.1 lipid-A-disaccharide synthase [Ideonella paludis]
MTPAPRLAMVAGEASGDQLASLLLAGLHERWPGTRAVGIGGPQMLAQGFEAWWPSDKLSVFGFVDALRHYRELVGIRNQLRDRLLQERPDVFIGVDAPDFNFGLEAPLKAAGIRTVHFVCPSIWAWRGERVKKLAAAADHVLCLYPFEPALLAQHGVAATFVGHPMADKVPLDVPRADARRSLALAEEDTVVALLPGSRRSEIRHIAPALLQAALLMAQRRPELRFVLPIAPGLRTMVEQAVVEAGASHLNLQLVDGRSHEVLAACDVTLIASGTATLEAALYKRPMVIVYRLGWLNWQLMRRMAYQPWFGLPNILLKDFVVPEFIQDAAEPQAIAQAGLAWLDDVPRQERLQRQFTDLHHSLRQDTSARSSDALATLLQKA